MIKTVFFDIDNTLYSFDEVDSCSMQVILDYCRQEFQMEKEEVMGYYKKAWKTTEDRVGMKTAAIHNRLLRLQCMLELMGKPVFPHAKKMYDGYWEAVYRNMKPSPGIEGFLKRLKEKGVKIGIATDMTAYVQYRKLETLGLDRYVDCIVTSEEAGAEKPSARFFDLCIEKAGCPVSECAFIGDSVKKDVEGSIAKGFHGIWYSMGEVPKEKMPFPVIVSFEGCLDIEEIVWKRNG